MRLTKDPFRFLQSFLLLTLVTSSIESFSQTVVTIGSSSNITSTRNVLVASGDFHVLTLDIEGHVSATGDNTYGQCDVPADLSDVKTISAGTYHSIALKANGKVICWGRNSSEQSTVPAGLENVIDVSAGDLHSAALKSDGSVIVWGDNSYGQTDVPIGLVNVIAISAGGFHTIALLDNGTVITWGRNDLGQTNAPAGLDNVISVSAGYRHSVALKADGSVVAWGDDGEGQSTVPAGLSDVIAVEAGVLHSVALKADGTATAWGNNDFGQATISTSTSNIVAIAAGYQNTILLQSEKMRPIGWGSNSNHETFLPSSAGDVRSIAAGTGFAVALRTDGTLFGWGDNYAALNIPVTVSQVKAIAAGNYHLLILKADGSVSVYGQNTKGQATVPSTANNVRNIAAGSTFSMALSADGTVIAWGDNANGQTTVSGTLPNIKEIQTGTDHALAIDASGKVWAWGLNDRGQANSPVTTQAIRIDGGKWHSTALLADGTAVSWGDNTAGQEMIPNGLANVTSIACGEGFTVVRSADGLVSGWGTLAGPSSPTKQKEIFAGAVTAYGTVINSAPNSTVKNETTQYFENSSATLLDNTAAIADDDDNNLASLIAEITESHTAGDVLDVILPPGLTKNYDDATGKLVVTGDASITTYQTLLQSLTFHSTSETPSTNSSRKIAITVTDGIDPSASTVKVVQVLAVNDAPSFTKGADISVHEDAAAATYNGWASNMLAGPSDEILQTLSFSTSNDNNALFEIQPSIDANGKLSFKPAANMFGTSNVSVKINDTGGTDNGGVNESVDQTFVINVLPVNDQPSFVKGPDVEINEGVSTQLINSWASSILTGPSNEAGQLLTFELTNDNAALFTSAPSLNANGDLIFTPAPDAYGTTIVTVALSDNGGTERNGVDKIFASFNITIENVNDAPSFSKGADITIPEDADGFSANWATNISAGPNEGNQQISFVVSPAQPELFTNQPFVNSLGVLSFTLTPDAYGETEITVQLKDNGGTDSGGDDTSEPQRFSISISPINDSPQIDYINTVTTYVNSPPVIIPLEGLNKGAFEHQQSLTIDVTAEDPSLFASITLSEINESNTTLTLTPQTGKTGTSLITLSLRDNGGTENGGVDDHIISFDFTIEDAVQEVFIPNFFSPNRDGSNDYFKVRGAGIQEIDFRIFSSAGVQVFSANDIQSATIDGWDGTFKGTDIPAGTYSWRLKGKYLDGKPLTNTSNEVGQLLLIR
jgi:gliding motility-associated-like protein